MVKINGKAFGDTQFSNGESIFMSDGDLGTDATVVEMVFESDADLGKLAMARMFIRDIMGENTPCYLIMKYIPYSRMDRAIGNQVYSLRYMADFLRGLKFSSIFSLDPHSSVSGELIPEIRTLRLEAYVERAVADFQPDVLMFPDKGASIKYRDILQKITKRFPVVVGEKVRDTEDKGKIISYKISDADDTGNDTPESKDVDLTGKSVLVIDDIVVRGGTVMHAAEELRKLGAAKVGFWVTHCEQAAFEGGIFDKLEQVYTTDSMVRSGEANNLRVYVVDAPSVLF